MEPIQIINCEDEPIHIPGLIQEFGVLLSLHPTTQIIECVSQNSSIIFGCEPSAMIGRPIRPFFLNLDSAFDQMVAKGGSHIATIRESTRTIKIFCNLWDDRCILEFESLPESHLAQQRGGELEESIDQLQSAKDRSELCEKAALVIQRLTNFDRVLIYKFDEEWNGAVVAEKLSRPDVDSYAELRFPASDIPAQARQMFLLNWLRMIPDVSYKPVPFFGTKKDRPLNLSLSLLRSPSPIHIEYLKNMRVAATLTISLIKDGKLWGLIACHHETPKYLGPGLRESCQIIGKLASAMLEPKEQLEDLDYRLKLKNIHNRLLEFMKQDEDFVRGLVRFSPNLLDLTNAQGAAAAVYFEGKWSVIGKVPSMDEINELTDWLGRNHSKAELFVTESLPSLYPPAENFKGVASGLLAISIPKSERNYVLWFRPEVIQTVNWAGNPEKSVQVREGSMTLHPRSSFALWKQKVVNTCLPWRKVEIETALELRKSIVELDLERQFKKERAARAETEAEKQRFSFLADASLTMSTSLNFNTTIETFAGISIKSFCDWCAFYLVDLETSKLNLFKIRHASIQGQRICDDYQTRNFAVPLEASLMGAAITSAEPSLKIRTSDQVVSDLVGSAEEGRWVRKKLGLESFILIPVITRSGLRGAVIFSRSHAVRRFHSDDLRLAQELIIRLAASIDNVRLYQAAQEASRAREEVLGIVSHDLKNPLNAIGLNVELINRRAIKHQIDSEILSGPLEKIDFSVKRMRNLIENILDAAKVEAGRITLDKRVGSIISVVEDSFKILEPLAEAKKISLSRSGLNDDCHVEFDHERILQVLSNIIGNAIKFTPPGGAITIKIEECKKFCQVGITDSGPGIPDEFLGRLFDRFWQAQQTSKLGTGLGLSIAKGIVEAHGGKIWVQSTVGLGTTFHFNLPK